MATAATARHQAVVQGALWAAPSAPQDPREQTQQTQRPVMVQMAQRAAPKPRAPRASTRAPRPASKPKSAGKPVKSDKAKKATGRALAQYGVIQGGPACYQPVRWVQVGHPEAGYHLLAHPADLHPCPAFYPTEAEAQAFILATVEGRPVPPMKRPRASSR